MTDRPSPDRDAALDPEFEAFLGREAARLVQDRPTDADVVAAIRARSRRRRPVTAVAAVGLVGIGLATAAAVALWRPSEDARQRPTPSPLSSLGLPVVGPGDPCPVNHSTSLADDLAPVLGAGPVHLAVAESGGTVLFEPTPGGAWRAIDALWVVEPGFAGKVTARGGRLDQPGDVGFGDPSDPLRTLAIDVPPTGRTDRERWTAIAETPIRIQGAGCYGLRVDSPAGASVVVFEARPIDDAAAVIDRPIELARLGSGAPCPVSPSPETTAFVGPLLGEGPVYLGGSTGTISLTGAEVAGGYAFIKSVFVADARELGPMVIRGSRIDGPDQLRFGPGSDPASELRLGVHAYEHTADQPPGWRIFVTYLRPRSPGCHAVQVDTLHDTLTMTFEVRP